MGQQDAMDGTPSNGLQRLQCASASNGEAPHIPGDDLGAINGAGRQEGGSSRIGLNEDVDAIPLGDDGYDTSEDAETLRARIFHVEEQLKHISLVINDLKSLPRHEALILLDQLRRRAHVQSSSSGPATNVPNECSSNVALSDVAKQVLSERRNAAPITEKLE